MEGEVLIDGEAEKFMDLFVDWLGFFGSRKKKAETTNETLEEWFGDEDEVSLI